MIVIIQSNRNEDPLVLFLSYSFTSPPQWDCLILITHWVHIHVQASLVLETLKDYCLVFSLEKLHCPFAVFVIGWIHSNLWSIRVSSVPPVNELIGPIAHDYHNRITVAIIALGNNPKFFSMSHWGCTSNAISTSSKPGIIIYWDEGTWFDILETIQLSGIVIIIVFRIHDMMIYL